MFRIFPRDEKFFQLLERLTEEVCAASGHLSTLLTAPDETLRTQANANISTTKANAKTVSLDLTKELCTSFVTPLDREDIQSISDDLYKIPKTIEKIAERIQLHHLSGDQSDFAPQAELIVQEAAAVRALMHDLIGKGDRTKIPARAALLHELEHKGDEIRSKLIGDLFISERDVRDLLIRRDIYDLMEKVVDRFRDVASTAVQTVLKNS